MFNQKPKEMYRTDTTQRYQGFLNETTERIREGNLKTLEEVKEKYGVSATLIPFLKHKGIIKQTNSSHRYPTYTTGANGTPFSEKAVVMLIAEFNRWKRDDKIKKTVDKITKDMVSPIRKTPKKGSCLTDVTTKEIISELKRRGYTGHITIEKTIEF